VKNPNAESDGGRLSISAEHFSLIRVKNPAPASRAGQASAG